MSLESQVAALTQQAGLLLDLPTQIGAQANTKISALQAAYAGIVASQETTFYVDQALGSDANAGTVGAPFKSIEAALALTPKGGSCFVYLLGPYNVAANIAVSGKLLSIFSSSSIRHALTFERFLRADVTPNLREVRGFVLGGAAAAVQLYGLTLTLPTLDGSWGGYGVTANNALFRGSARAPGNFAVGVLASDIVIPNSRFCPLFGGNLPMQFLEQSNTLPGPVTSLNGCVVDGQTNTAGVAASTIANLVTNRATV